MKSNMMHPQLSVRAFYTLLLVLILVLGVMGCQPTPQPEPVNGSSGIGDPYYPLLGNGGYDVEQYIITLDVDPPTNDVQGMTTITALATERLAQFNLDFEGLTVDSITVNDDPAEFELQDAELIIRPSQPLDYQRKFTVTVKYHGKPHPTDTEAIPFHPGWSHAENGAISVVSEPNGASSWYPNNDHPQDKATYRFEITVPKPWVVAATGKLKQTEDVGDKTLYVWEMNRPMASYLASINIDQYTLVEARGPNGVKIRSYFPPGYPESRKKNFDAIPEMMEYLNSVYGNYPFDEYGVIVLNEQSPACQEADLALEGQTMSIHCPSQFMAAENVIVHELAHQWFGDSVSLENWKDVWLKEGMATYAEWLWASRGQDLEVVNKVVYVQTMGYYPKTLIGHPPSNDLYRGEVYIGGGLVFHALRQKVGEKAFFKILSTYLNRYKYGNAGTDDFIAIAEEISKQDLDDAFFDWLNRVEIPVLTQ
jgi:aminopeptidase N